MLSRDGAQTRGARRSGLSSQLQRLCPLPQRAIWSFIKTDWGQERMGKRAGLGWRPRAWSDGTHCVFCMLFSIPFHPLPELSVHGLRETKHMTCYKLREAEVVKGPQALQNHMRQNTGIYLQQPCCEHTVVEGTQKRGSQPSNKAPRSPSAATLGGTDGGHPGDMCVLSTQKLSTILFPGQQGTLIMKLCRACQGHRHSAGRCWVS